uniref:Xrn1 N-terminal domain-containing protein n=1 Tax=viral metagenome TaxID=1070528 RepID=A0A6C0D671_9ZZZZ
MGIPSYFSHIIRNYPNIIRTLSFFYRLPGFQFDELYMDCNSIIYDAVHTLEKDYSKLIDFEKSVIQLVILKIEAYIKMIKPRDLVYIAFDGVAPFAKMEQQRTRRYKAQFMTKIENNKNQWNTSAITPGTQFMTKLCNAINKHFIGSEKKYNIDRIITSCSDEPGEGEHKLFQYIRNTTKSRKIAVYGLDSDLIMLSIFHLKYCTDIFIFREAPEFLKSSIPVDVHSKDDEPHFLDIKHLASCINAEMACKYHEPDLRRTVDYVFMCFLLGNDFLPHFPAMNIRTHGITALLDIYRKCIGSHSGRFFISNSNEIIWKHVKIFIYEVAKLEYRFLVNEYFVRDNFDKRTYPETTNEEKQEVLKNAPIIYRAEEKYICPEEPYWENRYYKTLFHSSGDDVKNICTNYLEGLEWVFTYYTNECVDWKWKYNYHYPPLFADLVKYIPTDEHVFIEKKSKNPFSSNAQLSYVLPATLHYLLPDKINSVIKEKYTSSYPESYSFQWAFCRYLWEAHPILPDISIQQLEYIDSIAV